MAIKRKRRISMLLKPEKAELFMTAEEGRMWKWKKQNLVQLRMLCFATTGYSTMPDVLLQK
jgi:hypothetical protein